MEMEGKVVVVTGASMGIGEAIAKIFADEGASVVLLSRDANRAEAARHRVGHTHRTLARAGDVRNREDIGRALALVFQHVDDGLRVGKGDKQIRQAMMNLNVRRCGSRRAQTAEITQFRGKKLNQSLRQSSKPQTEVATQRKP